MRIAFYGSSLLSAYWNGAATYYRGLLKALAGHGHAITFYEPDVYDRQKNRDIDPPDWCRVVVYPGTLDASATYTLTGNILALDLEARTTKPTVVNLTNHAYWNLSGGERNAFAHEMQIDAQSYLPLNDLLLPSGEIRNVEGLPQDFRTRKIVGQFFDNCWVLDGARGTLRHGLTLRDPVSGRQMNVWTTEAGMQMYTAFHWNEAMPGRNGPLKQYTAIAIEPQNFPDSPNHSNFPSAVLRPGEVYKNRMEWRFSR